MEIGKNKRMAINMIASFVAFIVNFGINFFLTPFIVKNLGAEAYGFVGLATNVISYTQLATIALNSMASRFISIKYLEGDVDASNKYFSSVFYSNVILSGFIIVCLFACIGYLEFMIEIPKDLILDVKILFCLLTLNTVLGLICNVYAIATFIKNRLELSSLRNIISYIIRALILIIAFAMFPPQIWYMGLASLIATIYISYANKRYTKILTPDLVIKRENFQMAKVKELLLSGIWNVLSKLGNILGQGLDLVIANLFIGLTAMGYYSITRTVPTQILALFQMVSAVFGPILTQYYAQKKHHELLMELKKTIRILGFFTTIPLACLFLLGEDFYTLWLPNEDAHMLQILTIVGCIVFVFAMPLESLWHIFTLTNKLKLSTIVLFVTNVLIFATVFSSMFLVESLDMRLLILAGSRSILGAVRTILFLPIYGAYCLNEKKTIFYPPVIKSVIGMGVTLLLGGMVKPFFNINGWFDLFGLCIVIACFAAFLNAFVILNKNDRFFVLNRIILRKKE